MKSILFDGSFTFASRIRSPSRISPFSVSCFTPLCERLGVHSVSLESLNKWKNEKTKRIEQDSRTYNIPANELKVLFNSIYLLNSPCSDRAPLASRRRTCGMFMKNPYILFLGTLGNKADRSFRLEFTHCIPLFEHEDFSNKFVECHPSSLC